MAPVPQELDAQVAPAAQAKDLTVDDDAVVISGMSAVLPGCQNVMEFSEKLYGKVNMVDNTPPRWKCSYPELSKYHGIIPKLELFDAQFFMIYHKLSHTMDAITRKLLEHSYQAIFDAGMCPSELSGRKIGVFIASGLCESEKSCAFAELSFGLLGCNRAMYANRISYYLNLKGPSMLLDADSSGSFVALEKAHQAIRSGQCDAALVGGAKILLHPQSSLHYTRLIPSCPDGKTRSYDENADGHALSEGINVIFLQKFKDSKRIYATLCYAKTSFGVSLDDSVIQKFGPDREPAVLSRFLKAFYDEVGISPSLVEYVEGFGSALRDADKTELQLIEEIFCKERSDPLLVGSVMSNVGFTDAASGITAMIKVLLAYQNGQLASNINCDNPRNDIAALRDGRMRILTDHHRFKRSYAAINNFSLTGINGHVLLQGYYKPKNLAQYHTDLPYLVLVSGRQESSVTMILEDLKTRPVDPEEIALLGNIHRLRISKHLSRGFAIYTTNDKNVTTAIREKVDHHDDAKRPLWFVYSGMGSQWAGMGAQLMRIPIFATAIQRCHKVLEAKGIDLINIISTTDKTIFDNIMNSFVGIAAIQIGLTDVLRAIGLKPDNIIGHSVGELGCAYGDGCSSAEEMILMAYCRGLVSIQTPFIRGSMAAVGIGYKQISKLIPPEIEVACHNGPSSSTISGPAAVMQEFVAQLTADGIFAKEVPCSNIAYHSRYIAEAGPQLLKYLLEVAPTPRLRSERWVSTSVPQENWDKPCAKYSSADYHTNNLLSPVLFEETLKLVPHNAVLVEIAPHGLLQAILKRSLASDCRCIPLTRRGQSDGALFLLEAIGKIYMEGYDIDVSALYPKIDFPVSTETRSLSHLVEWIYAEKLRLCHYKSVERSQNAIYKPIISIHDEEYYYYTGNIIEGVRVFPFAGALVSVWDTLAMTMNQPRDQLPVVLSDITLHVQPHLHDHKSMYLTISLHRASGRFEVSYEQGIIVEGFITMLEDWPENENISVEKNDVNSVDLAGTDIYKLLHERGYHYKNEFRSIHSADISLKRGELLWNNNWVTFLDGALQFYALRHPHDGISQPKYIKQLCIDPKKHNDNSFKENDGTFKVEFDEVFDTMRCGGLMIKHLTFKDRPSFIRQTTGLKGLMFVPFFQEENVDVLSTLYIFMQIVAENLNKSSLNALYINKSNKPCLLESISDLLNSPPVLNINIVKMSKEELKNNRSVIQKPDLIFLDHVLSDKRVFEALYHVLPADTFIISLGVETEDKYSKTLYRQVCAIGKGRSRLELARWNPSKLSSTTTAVSVKTNSDLEFLKATRENLHPRNKLLVLSSYPPHPELKDLVKQWRSEPNRNQIFIAMTNDDAEEDMMNSSYFDLAIYVLNNGVLGGEYYVPIQENQSSDKRVISQIQQPGNLSSINWVEVPEQTSLGIPVAVQFAGLSVYDAKKATAEIYLQKDDGFGMDFSGVTERGERVMGLLRGGSVCRKIFAQPDLLWPVPCNWSLEDAATVPLAYVFAFYCLDIKCRLVRGMRVLVHGGAGSLGQAAISIALANGCQVFTTVSDIHKKTFLRNLFPQLPAGHIGNSRDVTFEDMILDATNGEGCHIIISSVKGDLKQATLTCCATSGTTLDVVQVHTLENYIYGMYNMTKSRSYTPIDFSSIFVERNKGDRKRLQMLVSEGIARGYVRPLTRVTYVPRDVTRAFRLLAASRHRGRVLLDLQGAMPGVQPRIVCSRQHCQVIFCCNDGFGIQLAERLIRNGAQKLYIHCEDSSPYLQLKKHSWTKLGVHVHIPTDNLNKNMNIVALLKDCNRMAPVEGIYVVATGLTAESESRTKLMNSVNDLDSVSREQCPSLKYFAIISEDRTFGKEVSTDRARSGLPSLSFQLPKLEQFEEQILEEVDRQTEGVTIKARTALDALETALVHRGNIALAYIQPLQQRNIIDEVSRIPGINISSNTVDRTTLEQVGIDAGRAREVCNLLEEKFFITLSPEILPQMKIATLKALQQTANTNEDLSGFSGYFKYIDNDELVPNVDTILMRTRVHTSEMRVDEFEDLTYLCIVPGMEGHHERFSMLCERLKIPALVLQLGLDVVDETVDEMAQRLVSVMMKKLKFEDGFYLLGYEFGILVALEMAEILESRGFTGTVYCLGGTSEDIRATLDFHLRYASTETIQDELIKHMFTLMTGKNSDELKLKAEHTWKEKVLVCLNTMRGRVQYTTQYCQAIIEAAYNRVMKTRGFVSKQRQLKSKLVILRAHLPVAPQETQEIVTHNLNASLAHLPLHLRCASIVNKNLEPEILDVYYNRNHCESALLGKGNMVEL